MTIPVQRCELCGRTQQVLPDGRGFPPDIAKRKLVKVCKANDCPSSPRYTAGFNFVELRIMGQ
jgi:hypothetical protein